MMAAELVFIGQIAPDVAAIGQPAAEQARSALTRLERALGERELVLEDLLRLRLFVRDLSELPALEGALDAHLGERRPAVSIVELLPAGAGDRRDGRAAGEGEWEAHRSIAVTLDAMAAPGAREQRRLGPHSARLGPWVFLGAVTALAPRHDVPRQRRVLEESRVLFAQMEERLREQGAQLRDVLRLESWLGFPMREYGPFGAVRRALVGSAGLLPASAGVQVGRVGLADERLACEAIAYAPEDRGGGESKSSATPGTAVCATSRLADFYVDARAAGGYVFTSGEVPDARGSVRAQAAEVYERLRSHLARHGASPGDVCQQTVFVRHARDGDVLTEAAREFYGEGGPLPPTTLLTVADIGFHPGCDVEIELVAATDGPSTDAR